MTKPMDYAAEELKPNSGVVSARRISGLLWARNEELT